MDTHPGEVEWVKEEWNFLNAGHNSPSERQAINDFLRKYADSKEVMKHVRETWQRPTQTSGTNSHYNSPYRTSQGLEGDRNGPWEIRRVI